MRTLAELIGWRALLRPTREAVCYDGRVQTYGELNESSSRLAGALVSQLGIQPMVSVAWKGCRAKSQSERHHHQL